MSKALNERRNSVSLHFDGWPVDYHRLLPVIGLAEDEIERGIPSERIVSNEWYRSGACLYFRLGHRWIFHVSERIVNLIFLCYRLRMH